MHGRTPAFVTTLLGYKSNVTSSQAHVKLDLHDKLAHIRRQSKLVDPDKRMHYRERLPLIEGLLKQTSDAEITKSVSTVNRWIRTADVLCEGVFIAFMYKIFFSIINNTGYGNDQVLPRTRWSCNFDQALCQ